MLIPAEPLLSSLRSEFGQLTSRLTGGEGSALQSISAALNLLLTRERGDVASVRAQIRRLEITLAEVTQLLPATSAWRAKREAIKVRLAHAASAQNLRDAESAWRAVLLALEVFARYIVDDVDLDPGLRTAAGLLLSAWEIADLKSPFAGASSVADPSVQDGEVTFERLTAYLRDRFADPSLEIQDLKPLAGGFGKQTFVFEVQGRRLVGSYVMRRDLAEPVIDNDCHRIHMEYALIRALNSRGFPAPEALWIDVKHRLLPGGDFLVMRQAPGTAGGSVFAANGKIPRDLVRTLASVLARLHALPPMPELDRLNESLNVKLWNVPVEECVRRYITGFRDLFDREPHLATPALASLFGWLLDNVPRMKGMPVLLHGDIGFHNFLFDEGKLTAVLDWEFGHLGDPSEDLAYAFNTLGLAVDSQELLAEYCKAGGGEIGADRLRYFRVWGHVRNACAANLISAKFASGRVADLKIALLPHHYIPQFLSAASQLIETPA